MPLQEQPRRPIRVGLIGAGIQLSKSPALHEREGRRLGLDYRYRLMDVDRAPFAGMSLPDLLDHAQGDGLAGLNVTHPFKQAVLPHLDALSDEAKQLGAVNTVVFASAGRVGHNTDWHGFFENFRRGLPDVARERVVLLGAGGAGVAVAYAAMKLDVRRLLISDSDGERAGKLATELRERFGEDRAEAVRDVGAALAGADGLIHATPTGMPAHPGLPIEAGWLEARHWVADIVYMPLVTELLSLAARLGCRTLPGGGMTVHQAARAFELFCGIRPDADRMEAHFAELCTEAD